MSQKNRIIALIDFSDYAQAVIGFASAFSKIIDARVLYVHKVAGYMPALTDLESKSELLEAEYAEAREKLRELTEGLHVAERELVVSDQSLVNILHELRSEHFTDWVFAGVKGTGQLKKLFIGSNTVRIIDESKWVTVVLPVSGQLTIPDKLVVSVSEKFPVSKKHVRAILSSMGKQLSGIELITVVNEGESEDRAKEYLEKMKRDYPAHDVSTRVFKGDNVFSEISSYMKTQPNSFLVVQPGGRLMSDMLFRKFTVNELVYNGSIPLIALPE